MSVCMSGTHGSGVLSNTGDVFEMGVVRGVGGVCDMCMCLARAGVGGEGGEWMRELGLDVYQSLHSQTILVMNNIYDQIITQSNRRLRPSIL